RRREEFFAGEQVRLLTSRQSDGLHRAATLAATEVKKYQLCLRRYFSWQLPQSFLPMLPKAFLKDSRSVTLPLAAFASLPNLARRALKSSMFSQIFGLAVYGSSAVGWSIECSGNKAGAFAAVSSKVAKIFLTLARSNGASPLVISAPILA